MSQKLWQGRFSGRTDRMVETFTASIDTDKRLYAYDVAGSIAHCKMLAKQGVMPAEEAAALIQGLGEVQREIEQGRFEFDEGREDIHMHIEARLTEKVGRVAMKLHTARSRNDQVALDVRMYLRDEVRCLISSLTELRRVIVKMAKAHIRTVLPGYTHLQRAQPVLLAHHLMAYYEMFSRDVARLKDCLRRINVMPLGSAALAGTSYPIDRDYTAKLLGFPEVSGNSIDAVSDRDFMVEFLSAASLCMIHLSRLSEEIILWSSAEFGFIELPDMFATGSSIMPQKKNPDVAELVRGKSGRVFGALMTLLTVMKSLPLAYNRDMQEDKAPLFDAVDTLKACVDIYIKMLPGIKIKKREMAQAASKGFLNATDLADYLVGKGMAFREAHHCAGQAVRFALSHNKELHELTLKELKSFSTLITRDVLKALKVDQVINRRHSYGGTAADRVAAAVADAERRLKKESPPKKGRK